jgi:hypothetical protein
MQAQRQKEQLLIDRGEQYKRAIQLYFAKTKRYPAEIKDLESFQNTRFLRHRYIDPMTGKDEWRLIHIQNGMLTDSRVSKQGQQQKEASSTAGMYIGEQVGLGGNPTATAGGGAVNIRNRTRQNDGAVVNGPPNEVPPPNLNPNPNATSFPNTGVNAGMPPTGAVPGMTPGTGTYPGMNPNPTPMPVGFGQPNIPGAVQMPPGVPTPPGGLPPGYQVGVPGVQGGIPAGLPGSTAPRPTNTTNTGNSNSGAYIGSSGGGLVGSSGGLVGTLGSTPTTPTASATNPYPGTPTYPGQLQPGMQLPPQPGAPVNSQFQGQSPYQTTPGANPPMPGGFPQPGTNTNTPNQAADLIRNILTTPRPGGMPTSNAPGQTIGGGLAGVASTSDGEGVKVYNDHTNYAEWEFVFDYSKPKQIPNPNAQGTVGTPASQLGSNPGSPLGQPLTTPGMNPLAPAPPGVSFPTPRKQ